MSIDMTDPRLGFPKKPPRIVDRIQRKADLAKQERECRQAVRARDKGRCRIPNCKCPSHHLHHIVYRSHGGKCQTSNVVSLCGRHHGFVHAALIRITGNADEKLIIAGDLKALRFKL
jgi:5-methylcytosine-specific restriction endonuclease McrA